jgi:hypothetical protein
MYWLNIYQSKTYLNESCFMPDTLVTDSLQFTDMKKWHIAGATGKSKCKSQDQEIKDWFRLEMGVLVDTQNLVVVPQIMERKQEIFVNFH